MSEDEKLTNLASSIDKAKQGDIAKFNSSEAEEMNSSSVLQVGADLLAGVGVGVFIGYMIDKYLGTTPIFIAICLIFGFAGGFWNVIKRTKSGVD